MACGSGETPLTPFSHHTLHDNGHGGVAAPAALLMTNPPAKFLKRQRSSLLLAMSLEAEWSHCG